MSQYIITGGAGFVGSNLALELEKRGNKVTIIDTLFSGNKRNLFEFEGRFINGSETELRNLPSCDALFHIASITDPRHEDDDETYSNNVNGFKETLDFVDRTWTKLVYASSSSVYGNGPVPMHEDQQLSPVGPYARSKLKMEKMAQESGSGVGLRYFNVFGPREKYKGRTAHLIYHFGKAIHNGERPIVFGDGEQKRDSIFVKDVVEATILGLDADQGIYNVGTGVAPSFNEMVKCINKVLGKNLKPEYRKNPFPIETYQMDTQADTIKSEQELDFRARWNLEDAIKDYFSWLDKNDGWN
jgi:ADP-L-glycero-D-manno-heptose 6-epimerase